VKELLIVGGSAALGGVVVSKYGASIEAKAVQFKIPPTLAHMGVVGGTAALVYYVLRSVL
jgi:hypothetical protein